jgi:glycosyltransferase involved in cell wall biosynthesis
MPTSVSASKPLRILSLLNLDWNRHFGAARVYMELEERWKAAGHAVEHFSFSEAFPAKHRSPREYAIRRMTFPQKAAEFVRSNSRRFDVIDSLIGSLSVAKSRLGFDGLLVARSVGSHRLYDRFERSVATRWPGHNTGTLAGKLFYSTINRRLMKISDVGIRHADLINVPNTEEADFLKNECGIDRPIVVESYGLSAEHNRALSLAAERPAERLEGKTVSFVGMWTPRKGSRIWGEIIRRVRERIPDVQFQFLGTMVSAETVLRDVGVEQANHIKSVSEFPPNELPDLLSTCAVGAFPSYVEGFGLAILEQLAAGIPTVAFDQGGPRDILRGMPELLVATGDVENFAAALTKILRLATPGYEQLVQASLKTADQYRWSDIAQKTFERYQSALAGKRN